MSARLPLQLLCVVLLCSNTLWAGPADPSGSSEASIQELVTQADALMRQNHYEAALLLLQQAQAAASQPEATALARNVLNSLANLYYSTGQLEAAARSYRELVEHDRQAGDEQGLSVSLFNLAHTLASRGDFSTAEEQLEQALALSRRLGDANGEAFALKALGVNAHARGDLGLARQRLLAASEGFANSGDVEQAAAVQRHLGDILLDANEPGAAVTHFQAALATLAGSSFNSALLHSYRGLSLAWEQLGQHTAALQAEREHTELLRYDLEQRDVENTQRLQAELQTRRLADDNARLALIRDRQAEQLAASRQLVQLQYLALALGAGLILLVGWMLYRSRLNTARMQHLATTDELTQLLNRRAVLARGQEEWLRATRFHQPLACLMFDADHFKSINDHFGHTVGDEVLRTIAACLRGLLRQTDVLGRIGGEEFLLVAPQTDRLQAMALAERIRAGIEACDVPGLAGRRLSVSIGVAGLLDEEGIDALVKHADQALYIAKSSGRNRCILYHDKKPALLRPVTPAAEPLLQP